MSNYSKKILSSLSDDDYSKIFVDLDSAIKNDSYESLKNLAEELKKRGYQDESKKIYSSLIKNNFENHELKIPLAEIAIEENDFDTAFEYLDSIPKTSEFYPYSLLVQADIYYLLNIYEVVEHKLQELDMLAPDDMFCKFSQAEFYFFMENIVKALDLYQIIKDNPENFVEEDFLNERIGMCLSILGEYEEAINFLEKAIEVQTTEERLFELAKIYANINENQRAIELLTKIKKLNPDKSEIYLPLASYLIEENSDEEAFKIIKEGIKYNPNSPSIYNFAAELSLRLGKLDQVEQFYRKALELEEYKDSTLLKLSSFILKANRFSETIKLLEPLKNSDYPIALWNLAKAYNGMEDFKNAIVYYQKAENLLISEPEFLKEYGLFLIAEGKQAKAKNILQKYLEIIPFDLEVINIIETKDYL